MAAKKKAAAKKAVAKKVAVKVAAKAVPEAPARKPVADQSGHLRLSSGSTWNWSLASFKDGASFHAHAKNPADRPVFCHLLVDFNRVVDFVSATADGSEIIPKVDKDEVRVSFTGREVTLEVEWADVPEPTVAEWEL